MRMLSMRNDLKRICSRQSRRTPIETWQRFPYAQATFLQLIRFLMKISKSKKERKKLMTMLMWIRTITKTIEGYKKLKISLIIHHLIIQIKE